MPGRANASTFAELQEAIDNIEGGRRRARKVLPFGVPAIDSRLPYGGLAYGAIHEIGGGGSDAVSGASSALFTAGIAARTTGKVLWCLTRTDLFVPGLARAGLHPDRIIFAEADDEVGVCEAFEEALRFGGLAAVVGEMVRLPMDISRRFQLAAEKTGTLGLVLRRWRRQQEATDFGNPTAAATRWRVSPLPSEPLPVAGIGRARWMLEMIRQRAGECFDVEVSACDAKGHMASIEEKYGFGKGPATMFVGQ
ncbi:ImuA family protein [Agrobacterium tomkonis]|uniref:ImuA family protein n=1 Tax=Agrobacterium tomkonis TaxID=1183410 RepID=UPI001CD8C7E0